MSETTDSFTLPAFEEMYPESPVSSDTLDQMLSVAFDPATEDPGADLIPDPDSMLVDVDLSDTAASDYDGPVDLGDLIDDGIPDLAPASDASDPAASEAHTDDGPVLSYGEGDAVDQSEEPALTYGSPDVELEPELTFGDGDALESSSYEDSYSEDASEFGDDYSSDDPLAGF